MNKLALRIIYVAFILVMISLFSASCGFLLMGKLFLLIVLSFMLFNVTIVKKVKTIYHRFNIIFAMSMVVFVVYVLFFKSVLYPQVRLMFFLGSLIGLAMALYYAPKKRKMMRPPKPMIIRQVAKEPTKEAKETTVVATAQKKPAKTTKKKVVTKKSTKKVAKKTTKKSTKKTTKKSSRKSTDAKLISFSKDHEVAYLLRKHKKRITKANKDVLKAEGKKFKSMKSFKPHNRDSFYKYMKQYKVLSKLN